MRRGRVLWPVVVGPLLVDVVGVPAEVEDVFLRDPEGADWAAVAPLVPVFLTYVLSFVVIGIYWNNHHHMLQAAERINGKILWANLHLLFWLSLMPFATGWMGQNHFAPLPTAIYGVSLLMPALAWQWMQWAIVHSHGRDSALARALGRDLKGQLSLLLYAAGIGVAFVATRIAGATYLLVALMWLIPDRRIERVVYRP